MNPQRGQITVFIALMFQVLFVFFAMSINVGMTVHDKINLQNSVDIAAYYGAQKQAEILNVIAHLNYQIRQDWKLLAWRLRGFGDSSREEHPATGFGAFSIKQQDKAWSAPDDVSLCMTNRNWKYNKISPRDTENICAKGQNISIPAIKDMNLSSFFPWDKEAEDIIKDMRRGQLDTCEGMGMFNFQVALSYLAAYRFQVGKRQSLIKKLVGRLKNFEDLDGNSIKEGMKKTLRANLTRANQQSLDDGYFEVFNSLADFNEEDWLPNSKIIPVVFYTDLYKGSEACQGEAKFISHKDPNIFMPRNSNKADAAKYYPIVREPVGANMEFHSTRGREKNPWVMVYVGVKAETKPRKPFFPFGEPISLKARAFAKPFGGRIGPWTKTYWQRQKGWAQSGEDVDPLMPPRFDDPTSYELSQKNVPNFSRFPGDKLGLKSGPTLSLIRSDLADTTRSVHLYDHLPDLAMSIPLAFTKEQKPNNITLRQFEVAAVAPDVFDITYYSIQPEFYHTFGKRLMPLVGDEEDFPHDLGSLPEQDIIYDMKQQIVVANESFDNFKHAFFKVSNWKHLLTNWAPKGTMDYSFPEDRFGKCSKTISAKDGDQPTDSSCVAGGRAGYSVKLVAKSYLQSKELALGGDPNTKGPILNPPPPAF
tara:strand:+ start:2686 stop:4629 length:1944 start_codon:yes stop_codon:yes gene_type:complete